MSVIDLLTDQQKMPALGEIITTASACFSAGTALVAEGVDAPSSAAWWGANKPMAIPFVLNDPVTVYQLGWQNGSAAGGGIDVGIYDTSFNRLVSGGGTTGSGNSLLQFVDVADTVLPRGRYYLCMACDNVTANRLGVHFFGWFVEMHKLAGTFDSSTNAYPLPNPLTNMVLAATATTMPHLLIATRALV